MPGPTLDPTGLQKQSARGARVRLPAAAERAMTGAMIDPSGVSRQVIIGNGLPAGHAALSGCSPALLGAAPAATALRQPLPDFYEDIEERTFRFFWETANRANGLVPDRWPSPSASSIAAVGFALTAYAVGVERGWCSRAEARDLTLTTLRFFWTAPQGSDPVGMTGHKGFFYHFLDIETGQRHHRTELSTMDSTLLLLGILFAGQYHDESHPAEAEIRMLAHAIYARADWNFFRSRRRGPISMGWRPERGRIKACWTGYNEAMAVNLLALAAPVHPVPADGWSRWASSCADAWHGSDETRHLAFGPLFGHQYSHAWIDFRGLRDEPMRRAGIDYFENSRRATYANRGYCEANPKRWDGYSGSVWGLTACDGPGRFLLPFKGERRPIRGYSARGPAGQPGGIDDGTLSPAAALGSLPFAPEIVIPCAEALLREHGTRLYGRYGFLDAFNPSFRDTGRRVRNGSVDPRSGWVGGDYVGIDQGPILLQAANHRTGFVWEIMRQVPAIRLGLRRAGFSGGWLDQVDAREAAEARSA